MQFYKMRDLASSTLLCFCYLGSIKCKHIVRWQHLSRIKARLYWLVENDFFPIKTQQATSGTSAATYELMEPHWLLFGSMISYISFSNATWIAFCRYLSLDSFSSIP